MLKRNDLVQQFSLVVKQEMKNNQDVRLATNLAINSLKEQIDSLSALFSKKLNKLENELVFQKIKYEELHKDFLYEESARKKIETEFRCFYKKTITTHEAIFNVEDNVKSEIENIIVRLDSSFELDVKVGEQIHDLYKNIAQETKRLDKKLSNELQRAKQEIIDIPSEALTIKKELEDKIECKRIDSEGVMRELAIIRKKIFVFQKELEHVNMLIKRVSDGGNK